MKKLLTVILDGFGYREEEKGNAIKAANMQTFNELWNNYPHTLLDASGSSVGLNEGQMGNSEVGHLTIGAGYVLKQNEILVNEFLENIDLENESIKKLLELKEKDIHLMGLCSDGNVHAGIDDFLSMFKFLYEQGFQKIHFHLLTDGRDTQVNSAYQFIKVIQDKINEYNIGDIVSICGRYYGMDRDENWDRTKLYYDLVVKGIGERFVSFEKGLLKSYQEDITDEFIKPILLNDNTISNGDVLIWMNYREDRGKQILNAMFSKDFNHFNVKDLSDLNLFTFFEVDKKVKSNNFLEAISVEQPLGIYLSNLGFTQARVAESEKYPHVTYFFDGGYEGKIEKCDKFHIPSPDVSTYDLKPEMSAVGVTKKVIRCMENDYDFILANYANPDMVGHTGEWDASIKACMAVDICLKALLDAAEENFYKIIILADHGNVEMMINDDNIICTTHTTNKVPFIIVDNKVTLAKSGSLANVAPTILDYLDIAIPKDMQNSDSLIKNGKE